VSELAAPDERYYVISVTGYPVGANSRRPTTSFSVLDSGYCHREVYRDYSIPGSSPERIRRARAERECARLNAIDKITPSLSSGGRLAPQPSPAPPTAERWSHDAMIDAELDDTIYRARQRWGKKGHE